MIRRRLLARFDGLSVRHKILAGYAALIVPLLALVFMAGVMSVRILALSQAINGDSLPALQALESIRNAGVTVIEATNTFALIYAVGHGSQGNPEAATSRLAEVLAARDELAQAVREFEAIGDTDGGGDATFHRNIAFAYDDIVRQSDRIAKLAMANTTANVLLDLRDRFERSAANFRTLIQTAIDAERTELTARQQGLIRLIWLSAVIVIGFGLVGVGSAIVGGMRVSARIARPIRRLRDVALRIGDGNLEVPDQPHTQDEVGELVAAFRTMVERLKESMVKLARQERLATLGQLAGTVSHELRNPLGAIRNSLFSLRASVAGNPESGAGKLIDRIERNITRCNTIVTDLLDYARGGGVHPAPVDIDPWLNTLLDEHAIPPGATLRRELHFDGTATLDQERFRQVLVNLLDNALQAIADPAWQRTGPKENRIVVRSGVAGPFLLLSVEDTGPGMPQSTLAKIFEPLFTTKSFGIGLGLPMVRQIVQQHAGTIDVTSDVGKGTQFVIRVPRFPHQQERAA